MLELLRGGALAGAGCQKHDTFYTSGARSRTNDRRRRARETNVKHVCLSARWPQTIAKYVCTESTKVMSGLLDAPEHNTYRYFMIKVSNKLEHTFAGGYLTAFVRGIVVARAYFTCFCYGGTVVVVVAL